MWWHATYSVTTDKELSNSMCGSTFYVVMYRSCKLLKSIRFLDHPLFLMFTARITYCAFFNIY